MEDINKVQEQFIKYFTTPRKIGKLTFKDIKNWFGNRGVIVNRNHLIKYWNDDTYIYWKPNNKTCDNSISTHYENTVLRANIWSMYFEIDDELDESTLQTINFR